VFEREFYMDIGQVIFNTISNPDVAYVLLILGLFSAIFAFAVPGTGLAEIAAGLCLVLALVGLSRWDVDFASVVLILIGVGLFIIDLKLQSGAIAVGGALSLGIGSAFLIKVTPAGASVSLWLVAVMTLGSLAFFGFGINRAIKVMHLRPKVDVKSVLGAQGVLKTSLLPGNQLTGTALIGSELWTVRSSEPLPEGAPVVVDRVQGLVLYVNKVDSR
jgi:membrane-bound serine protease (ClpP class)